MSACPVPARGASPWQRARAFAACRPCVAGWAVYLVVAVLIVALYGVRQRRRPARSPDPLPALILTAPLFVPLARAYGIDLVHLGLIMTCNLAIGLYTPPVGGTLFVAARLARAGIAKVSYALIPMFAVTLVVLFAITYITALPMGLVWLLR